MIGAFADKITNYLMKNGFVPREDREIYAYGLHLGIIMIINFITFILFGLFFKMVKESLVFMIFYIPLRTYTYDSISAFGCKDCFLDKFYGYRYVVVKWDNHICSSACRGWK